MNWRRFFRRTQADAEQRQELEFYLEVTAEEYVAQGMGIDEARRAARHKLGNLTRIREEVYEMNTATFVDGTLQELCHAGRMLRLNPAFSLTAILTLALGIGATTAMFSVVNGVLIKPLPYPDSEAVVAVTHSAVFGNVRGRDFPFSPQMLATYLANNQSCAGGRPRAGTGGTYRAGRGVGTHRASTNGGEPHAEPGRRSVGSGVGLWGPADAGSFWTGGIAAIT